MLWRRLPTLEPWQLQEALRSLERKEFVRREHRSSIAGASQHAFQHALVRDAAYGQIPRAVRATRHVAAASWIESLPEDRADDRAETLAYHYLTAIDLYRAAGEDEAGLRERAAAAALEAGERALLLHAYPAAAHFLDQAFELLPEDQEPEPALLFAAGAAFGFVGRKSDELARAVEAFERAGDPERAAEAAVMASRHAWHAFGGDVDAWLDRAGLLVEGRPTSRAKALVVSERARRNALTFRPETGRELALAAIQLARDVGDVEIEAHSLVTLGSARVALGDARGVQDLQVALELVGRRGTVAGRAMTNLGWAYNVTGDLRRSNLLTVEAIELAEREGDVQGAWFTRTNLVDSEHVLGRWDEALRLVDLFSDAPEGVQLSRVLVRSTRARILGARDRGAEAMEEIEGVLAHMRTVGDVQVIWGVLNDYGRLARRLGRVADANSALSELMDGFAMHESVGDPTMWHSEVVLELLEAGRADESSQIVDRLTPSPWRDVCSAVAERRFVEAADILAAAGEQTLQAELRLLAARQLVGEGRQAEAALQLDRARAFWTGVGATAYLREADELFAAVS